MEPQKQLSFGSWLRGRRAERRQSMPEAAGLCGVSRALWADWEREAKLPGNLAHIRSVAKWAGVCAHELLPMLPSDSATG